MTNTAPAIDIDVLKIYNCTVGNMSTPGIQFKINEFHDDSNYDAPRKHIRSWWRCHYCGSGVERADSEHTCGNCGGERREA